MRVSVSVVTFQQVNYIRQALESVLRQVTEFPFEVIVGDDASTDGTREILEDIHACFPEKVKLLLAVSNHRDHGLSNVMAPIDAAKGEYIAFLDGDDYWTASYKLQRQVEFMDAHPECMISAHQVIHIAKNGSSWLSVRPGVGDASYAIDNLLEVNFTPKSSTMVRRSAVDNLPDWYRTTKVASAAWLFNLLTAINGKIGFIDDVMAAHRVHSNSVTCIYGANRMLTDKLEVYRILRNYLPEHEAALLRAERRIGWKLRTVRVSPNAYHLIQKLYNFATRRRS